jgi:hypothetical protein
MSKRYAARARNASLGGEDELQRLALLFLATSSVRAPTMSPHGRLAIACRSSAKKRRQSRFLQRNPA